MEWREHTSVSCLDAFSEARRWMEEVTKKSFGSNNFRSALENGVLLCDLINQLKPGLIKRLNRLSTPIAGLDNVNVFLKACGKLGLNEAQLFHPGDLQDLSTRATLRGEESNRRLKNVLITIYWLGRKAHVDPFYSGPQLNFKAFEGLLGLALSKALEDGGSLCVRDGDYSESWYPEREELQHTRPAYRRGDSTELGCGSDAEAEQGFRSEAMEPSAPPQYRAYVPAPFVRRSQGRRENARGFPSPLTRSKSLGDVTQDSPIHQGSDGDALVDDTDIGTGESNLEQPQTRGTRPRDGEARWHDDLNKWKLRRRSTNSDLLRKLQDRDATSLASGPRTGPTEKALQSGLQKRDQQFPSSHTSGSVRSPPSSPTSKQSCPGLRPHTRVLLARNYTTEALYSPTFPYSPHSQAQTQLQGSSVYAMPASDPSILGERIHSPSLASGGAEVTTPTLDSPFSSQTSNISQASPAPFLAMSDQTGTDLTNRIPPATVLPNETTALLTNGTPDHRNGLFGPALGKFPTCMDPKVPTSAAGPVSYSTVDALTDHSYMSQEEAQRRSRKQPAQQAKALYRYSSGVCTGSGSASLPRGYRRSEGSSRLSGVITAKPFGTKSSSRVSSLPRLCNQVDGYNSLLDVENAGSLQDTRPTLHRQAATSQIRGQYPAAASQNAGNQEVKGDEEQREAERSATPFGLTSYQTEGLQDQPYPKTQFLPQPYGHPQHPTQPLQKPYFHQQILYSTRLSVPCNQASSPPEERHSDMRVSLSLKPNSRPDFGFQTHWDSTGARVKSIQLGSPAEQCQLCVGDEIVAVDGIRVAQMSNDQWRGTMTSALQTGSLSMDVRRYGNKDWGSAGSHLNPPWQSRKTLNLTADAPMLVGRTHHHANNTVSPETTTVKSAHFNGQPVSGVSSKGLDGGHCDSPMTTGSKGGSESAISDLQVPSLSSQSSSYSWDHEDERRRQERWQEEQERLLQERYQRDQERMDAEWQRAQQEAMGDGYRKQEVRMGCEVPTEVKVMAKQSTYEMTNGVVSPRDVPAQVNGVTNQKMEAWKNTDREESKLKEAASKQQVDEQDGLAGKKWTGGSCGLGQLSSADRAKSKSTGALGDLHKQSTRGDSRKGQGMSQAEQERQQILEEMRKRTQLLTDNSWIRQRSTSMHKEPICIGGAIRRYESLDNLHTSWPPSLGPTTSSTAPVYSRPQSAAAGYCSPGRSCSPRYSTGPAVSQRQAPWSSLHLSSTSPSAFTPGEESAGSLPSSQQCGSVWTVAGISEEQCQEARFSSEVECPTVSTAISNSSEIEE